MRVVADTTPLRYLVVLGYVDLLPALFGQIFTPPAVAGELHHPKAPAIVRAWIARPPAWLDIRPSQRTPDARLLTLDAGEREAILLTQELQTALLLVDEREARREAEHRALTTMGTLRVLELAAERGLVDLPTVLRQLQAARFYVTQEMVQELLVRDARREQQNEIRAAETTIEDNAERRTRFQCSRLHDLMTKAVSVIGQSARYMPAGYIVIGRPDFESLAIKNADEQIASGRNYKLIPVSALAEMLVLFHEKKLITNEIEKILVEWQGHITVGRITEFIEARQT